MKLPRTEHRLSDRTGQTWAYMGRPFTFLYRGDGPQGPTAPWNDWIALDLVSGTKTVLKLHRETSMEDQPDRWERLA